MNAVRKYLQYVSDIHLEKGFKRVIKAKKPYLLLGGDIGYPNQENYKEFLLSTSQDFEKIFILTGNHEYDGINASELFKVEDKVKNICNMRNNLFYLQKDTHKICKNIYIAGCTFWSPLPKSKTKYHLDHVNWLINTLKSNPQNNYIVATHHCPLYECLNNTMTPNYFASDQTDIIKFQNMAVWIYGHSHIHKDIKIYDKWLISNQYGSYPNPLFGFKN